MSDDDSDAMIGRLHSDAARDATLLAVAGGAVRTTATTVVAALAGLGAEAFLPGSGPVASAAVLAAAAGIDARQSKLRELQVDEALASLEPRLEEIREKHTALVTAGAGTVADVAALVEAFLAAWTSAADRRVREYIENATVNAFDPKKYEEGLARTIIALLGRVDYGELALLRTLVTSDDARLARGASVLRPWSERASLDAMYATRLVELRLAFPNAERVRTDASAFPTALGRRVLDYIDREKQLNDLDRSIGEP